MEAIWHSQKTPTLSFLYRGLSAKVSYHGILARHLPEPLGADLPPHQYVCQVHFWHQGEKISAVSVEAVELAANWVGTWRNTLR
jgi:hypothetical protein